MTDSTVRRGSAGGPPAPRPPLRHPAVRPCAGKRRLTVLLVVPLAVDVLFPLPLPPFRYLVPFDQQPGPLGARVAAPWQGGVRIGLAVGFEELPPARATEYREVIDWLDREPYLAEGAAGVLLELAEASAAPAGVVLATLVPVGFRDELIHEVSAVEGAGGLALPQGEWLDGAVLGSAELDLYRRQGMVRERVRPVERAVTRLVPARPADAALAGRAQANQLAALERLEQLEAAASAAELARDADVPESAVRALVRKGYALYRDMPAPPAPLPAPEPAAAPLEPLGDGPPATPVALVTGGLRRDRLASLLTSLRSELAAGRSALVLVPEGAFLAETASLLAGSLPVLLLSGEASDEQRSRVWEEAASGRPVLLVGTYGVLFAPLRNLGLLVVLEAGSASYKLQAGPRLFVPAAARLLAETRGVPLVLSDALASPEMTVWAGPSTEVPASGRMQGPRLAPPAGTGDHPAAELRLPNPRQRLFVSDLGETSGWPIGSELALVLRQVQERGRQAVLLAPRRGFSAALACQECGHMVMCPNCDLALRYHRSHDRLRCHQCGHESAPPAECPNCASASLAPGRAAGTEWVAGTVRKLVPDLEVARLDSDHRDDLSRLRQGAAGVLVATSAVFRIPPLPNVSLIAVSLLDTHLNVSDFRAAEESLRLLLQLPELAPGGRPLVVVQTFQPQHEALLVLTDEEPERALTAYQERLLERRRAFRYPPFGLLVKLQVSARDRAAAQREAGRLAGSLVAGGARAEDVLGPVPAPVTRVRGQYTYLVYLRGEDEGRFHELIGGIGQSSGSVKVRLDVDPRDVAEFLE
jgi:primosomal protein N' (replication factor Y)